MIHQYLFMGLVSVLLIGLLFPMVETAIDHQLATMEVQRDNLLLQR